ncbi:MAG: GNAT family N-acetyltransferase [Geobacteraceae bacterium]|nr:GNAT family N-acetyltransferase [Geobacteraceae bacterium]
MIIEPFRSHDSAAFLKLAAAEQWVAEQWELDFLQAAFPEGCFCIRDSDGLGIAFVTSLPHETSGWIGNLIVAEGVRGRGFGEALFRKAQEALHAAGVRTFWLTASAMGRSLYERYGFRSIDTIVRWVGNGRQRHPSFGAKQECISAPQSILGIDSRCWGDRRGTLLSMTMDRGWVCCEESGFIVVQLCGEAVQVGPFSALDSDTAEVLFEAARRRIPFQATIFLDAPLSNRSAVRLFKRKGMRIAGENTLMYAGATPDYRPEILYGLASMGSCG